MFKHLLIFLSIFIITTSVQTCRQFLMKTMIGMRFNREETLKNLQHFFFLSGKSLNDFGFPDICAKQSNATYTTLQLTTEKNGYPFTHYLGLCFHNSCPAAQLNINYKLILSVLKNHIAIPIPDPITFNAVVPALTEQKYSIEVFAAFIIIIALVFVQALFSMKKWFKQNDQTIIPQYVSPETNLQYQNRSFQQRISIQYKYDKLIDESQQETLKIPFISIFRVVCIPIIILGQQAFYRTNAANNGHSFKESLFYSVAYRVALISLYLPDMMFFFSGYLFTSNAVKLEECSFIAHVKLLFNKILRLYPLYVLSLIYYWIINPAINIGPVWHIYQRQADICSTNWWRSLLLIDNLFPDNNCFKGSWFVQAEIQFTIISSILCYLYRKKPSATIVISGIVVGLSFLSSQSQGIEVPLFDMMNTDTDFKQHFTSSSTHLHYYILGVITLFCKNTFQSLEKQLFFKFLKPITFLVGTAILLLISTSSQGSNYTQSQLLTFTGFMILAVPFIMQSYKNKSPFHKIAYFTYPIVLVSSIITYSTVYSRFSFLYLSTSTLGNLMITQTIMSAFWGIIGGLMLFPFKL